MIYNRRNTDFMTLDEINAELRDLAKTPLGQRTVSDTDRQRDLELAKRRITNGRRRCL